MGVFIASYVETSIEHPERLEFLFLLKLKVQSLQRVNQAYPWFECYFYTVKSIFREQMKFSFFTFAQIHAFVRFQHCITQTDRQNSTESNSVAFEAKKQIITNLSTFVSSLN